MWTGSQKADRIGQKQKDSSDNKKEPPPMYQIVGGNKMDIFLFIIPKIKDFGNQ